MSEITPPKFTASMTVWIVSTSLSLMPKVGVGGSLSGMDNRGVNLRQVSSQSTSVQPGRVHTLLGPAATATHVLAEPQGQKPWLSTQSQSFVQL